MARELKEGLYSRSEKEGRVQCLLCPKFCNLGHLYLDYVYLGNNVSVPKANNTYCPNCQKEVIRREYYTTKVIGLQEGKCQRCFELILAQP